MKRDGPPLKAPICKVSPVLGLGHCRFFRGSYGWLLFTALSVYSTCSSLLPSATFPKKQSLRQPSRL